MSMFVGIHGRFSLHEWARRMLATGTTDEDVFSLVVERSAAYGFAEFSGHTSREAVALWGHNDAGGDWTEDGQVRQLAWLQVVPLAAGTRPPSIRHAALVLDEVTRHVGTYMLTGLHASLPTQTVSPTRAHFASQARWFTLADPTREASVAVRIATASRTTKLDSRRVVQRIRELSAELLEFDEDAEHEAVAQSGITSMTYGPELRAQQQPLVLRGTTPAWSLDAAVWITEVCAEAAKDVHTQHELLVAASCG